MESRYRIVPSEIDNGNTVIGANLNSGEGLKEMVFQALERGEQLPDAFVRELKLSDLLSHLKLSHRYYLNTKLPEIEQSIYALYEHKTKADDLLLLLCSFFIDYKDKLIEHIKLEERKLFPYIENLKLLETGNIDRLPAEFEGFSITVFEESHSDLEEDLERIRRQIIDTIGSVKTPLPFRIFLTQLEFFEKDMAVHAYLEDEVLVPKVLEKEGFVAQLRAG